MSDLRNKAIKRLVETGIGEQLAACVTDIVMEVFAENPSEPIQSVILYNGLIKIDTLMFEAWFDGKLINLTKKELKLLEYFMRNPSRIIPSMEILKNVWGAAHTDDYYIQYLCVFSGNINKKFGFKVILNKRGRGYYIPLFSEVKAA